MKTIVMAAVAAATLVAAGVASAAVTEADIEKAGCMKCHKMDAKGKGPSFKESAAKYKGKSADDVVKDMKEIKSHQKLNLPDDELKGYAAWVLTVK
jgi:cytochrome c551/c552